MQQRITEVLSLAKQAIQTPEAYAYLPEIIRTLEVMLNSLHQDREDRGRIARGLGRLVTEDYAFSESPLGTELLKLADDFASK